jgi:hypothetical protein
MRMSHFIERLGRHSQSPAAHEMDQAIAQVFAGHEHEDHDHDYHQVLASGPTTGHSTPMSI